MNIHKSAPLILSTAILSSSLIVFYHCAANAQTATNLICKGCVGSKDVGKNTIRSKHIKNGQVKPQDLSKSAKPAIAVAAEKVDDAGIPFTMADKVLQTATINVPGPGAVVALYNIWAYGPSVGLRAFCSATTGTTTAGEMKTGADMPVGGSATIGSAKTFEMSGPGNLTVNLVCRTLMAGTVQAAYPSIALLFVPNAQSVVTAPDGAEAAVPGVSSAD